MPGSIIAMNIEFPFLLIRMSNFTILYVYDSTPSQFFLRTYAVAVSVISHSICWTHNSGKLLMTFTIGLIGVGYKLTSSAKVDAL